VVTLEELTAGARKTEHGKVSATDVIMVVKKCSRHVASNTLKRLQDELRIPKLEMLVFGSTSLVPPNPGRGGNRLPEAAADAREMVQILWALPGDSSFRRNSADVVVRYLGGDPRLVSEVLANRAAQETLAQEDPSHPARIFGETVESERSAVAAKREAIEMLELEVREQELRTRLEASKAQIELSQSQAKRTRIETFVHCHETASRLGVEPDDRTRLQLRDMVQSMAIPSETLPRREICVRAFLLSKKANISLLEIKFGKTVAALKRARLRDSGLPDELPTKTIYANGQAVQAKLYFEEDLPLFEEAWETVKDTPVPSTQSPRGMRRHVR
jgi:hypothetical protein